MTSTDNMAKDDFRRDNPRFAEGNLDGNLRLVRAVNDMAKVKNCTSAQLAVAWVLAQGPALGVTIVLIPGTKRIPYLDQNADALSVDLTADDLDRLDRLVPVGPALGDRYTREGMKAVHA